jgi:hypothetical protein
VLDQSTAPDFFQEESTGALRSQVDWLTREVGLDDLFFIKLLETDEQTFTNWRRCDSDLATGQEEILRRFWQMMLHLFSFLNFDGDRVRRLFQVAVPACPQADVPALVPPWSGMPLKEYLERVRGLAIEKVDGWVTGLRFGAPYAA